MTANNQKKNLVVFCGARFPQVNESELVQLKSQLTELCQKLAPHYNLIYGGGRVGIMGLVADAFLQFDGYVTGVIPEYLNTVEIQHEGVHHTEVVDDLHQRKKMMETQGDLFLVLPGGLGTLDELCEVLTLQALSRHEKTIFIWNWKNIYDGFFKFIEDGVQKGMISANVLDSCIVQKEFQDLVKFML